MASGDAAAPAPAAARTRRRNPTLYPTGGVRSPPAGGDAGRPVAARAGRRAARQSNAGPGSVLRPGATSLWPASASIG